MAVDTPARIAVLGAGPVGLEAALYARFLGYDVELFDRGQVAEHVRRWGHVRMFSPFGMNATPLGLAAIAAQEPQYRAPPPDALLSGREWIERYLLPLSQTDLLADHLRLGCDVVAVSRRHFLKHEPIGEPRADSPFHILVQRDGDEATSTADIVLDTTGVLRTPNWLGPGGAPALGERAWRQRINYEVPDLSGAQRERYAGKRVLVVGGGHSAATSVVSLAELVPPASQVVWLTRTGEASSRPLVEIDSDPLVERARLTRRANDLAAAQDQVAHWPETQITRVAWDDARRTFAVELTGRHAVVAEFDEIIANVGYHPDGSLYAQLQVHECYATGGPMKLAASLMQTAGGGDCLRQTTFGPRSLVCPEPNFYILGAKSYGRRSAFLVSLGHQQIRELFTLIADREGLDLYRGAARLPGGA